MGGRKRGRQTSERNINRLPCKCPNERTARPGTLWDTKPNQLSRTGQDSNLMDFKNQLS